MVHERKFGALVLTAVLLSIPSVELAACALQNFSVAACSSYSHSGQSQCPCHQSKTPSRSEQDNSCCKVTNAETYRAEGIVPPEGGDGTSVVPVEASLTLTPPEAAGDEHANDLLFRSSKPPLHVLYSVFLI